MKKIKLVLENGKEFLGESIGCDLDENPAFGEIVFNTSMTGHQEILSDPSYCDQIVLLTYPLIGNYGIHEEDFESLNPALKGVVVKECAQTVSHWRHQYSFRELLQRFKIPGLAGIDTRELTKIIRDHGVMKGVLVSPSMKRDQVNTLLSQTLPTNQIARVSTQIPIHFPGKGKKIVLLDFGFKKNILRSLLQRDCEVVILPWNSSYDLVKSYGPQGIVLSNGPGNPKDVPEVLPLIKKLQSEFPIFSICMGHQLFALANGAETEKLKYGHRGGNHPVKDFSSGKVYMTSQNHGYTVVPESIPGSDLEVTQFNVNDQSIEGLRHKFLPAFSVQYHPEASPGPEDTNWLFDDFLKLTSKE